MFTLFFNFRSHKQCKKSIQIEKKTLKRKKLCHPKMHGKAIWKPEITEITTSGATLEPRAARINMLMHFMLWPMAIKLNSSWKMEVSKSAWIKPWIWQHKISFSYKNQLDNLLNVPNSIWMNQNNQTTLPIIFITPALQLNGSKLFCSAQFLLSLC